MTRYADWLRLAGYVVLAVAAVAAVYLWIRIAANLARLL